MPLFPINIINLKYIPNSKISYHDLQRKIQELKQKIQSIYDDAERFRDTATEEEKKYWNEVRRIFL